ncbi:MAG: transcriptional regulator [Paenibacillus sp.]|nr:transcriptional regulator [Paenibacillus sp.]
MNISILPELDRRRTQVAIEGMLEKYRLFKTVTFETKEEGTTYSFVEKFHGAANKITNQTDSIAAHNVDLPAARIAYCSCINSVVERLDPREQQLIRERYLRRDEMYDYTIYNHVFDPPVSKDTYVKIRSRAFYKMALAFMDLNLLSIPSLLKEGTGSKQ